MKLTITALLCVAFASANASDDSDFSGHSVDLAPPTHNTPNAPEFAHYAPGGFGPPPPAPPPSPAIGGKGKEIREEHILPFPEKGSKLSSHSEEGFGGPSSPAPPQDTVPPVVIISAPFIFTVSNLTSSQGMNKGANLPSGYATKAQDSFGKSFDDAVFEQQVDQTILNKESAVIAEKQQERPPKPFSDPSPSPAYALPDGILRLPSPAYRIWTPLLPSSAGK